MNVVKTLLMFAIATIAFPVSEAAAEKCNGYVITKSLKPVLLREAADGSKVQWFSSEGMVITVSPENHPTNRANRLCGGAMKIAPDGKSGSGMGSCTYTDLDGDAYHLNWEATFAGGTWKVVGGTGKFEKYTAQGTFTPTKRYQNAWGSLTWEGECNIPKQSG
jgi:hypothetical protein